MAKMTVKEDQTKPHKIKKIFDHQCKCNSKLVHCIDTSNTIMILKDQLEKLTYQSICAQMMLKHMYLYAEKV